jgi:DNA-binding response OmpR family regulator
MNPTRILLVDDEKIYLAALKERLEIRGLDVTSASDGPSAIEAMGRGPFDAIILDLQMPGMDGVETLKEILALDRNAQVIFLTGRGTIAKGIEVFDRGAIDFISKPADLTKLLTRIEDAAARRSALLKMPPGLDVDGGG